MRYESAFYLDIEKDLIVRLHKQSGHLYYVLETPNHHTGNLIKNLAKLCRLPLSRGENGNFVIRGEVPSYIDGKNREIYIFRLGNTKVANIYPDGRVEMKGNIPSIAKTLMSQTKDYRLGEGKTIFKTYILKDVKFHTDLHTHMNGNLRPDILIALGIARQLRYPLYYVKKLHLSLTKVQMKRLLSQRKRVQKQFAHSELEGKYLVRRIDDHTYINFADLILGNLRHAEENIAKIRASLAVLKDGQAVFTNLEKVYLYRYVFTKGTESSSKIQLKHLAKIPDADIREAVLQMEEDHAGRYAGNTVLQDCLLWIARGYREQGIRYAEISDTTLVKKYEALKMLEQVHAVMPRIEQETGVLIRFLAAIRRIPLTIVRDQKTPQDYLEQNLETLKMVAVDPYVAGCDFVGEEINDIIELKPMFREIVKIAKEDPDFVIRVHAGENDSLKENMAHSISCVVDSLEKGQKMPRMRIGHGLYSYSLHSAKGRKLLKDLKKYRIVLEFQITSNVRLNNLNSLDSHPLRQYLKADLPCVQGTDGGAMYGTNSIDEQLALEKLLGLSHEELGKMRRAEDKIYAESLRAFRRKKEKFAEFLGGRTLGEAMALRLQQEENEPVQLARTNRLDANAALQERIGELPWDKVPFVVAGGSFNTERRFTRMSEEGKRQIDGLMKVLDPKEAFFVIGHRMSGYEKYILDHNEKGFEVFAFVPLAVSPAEVKKIRKADVKVRVSIETSGMGIYKSINYEIFERRPSVLVGMDGNSAGSNLIQEARNGKGKGKIYVWEKARAFVKKAEQLEGYAVVFGKENPLSQYIKALVRRA